MTRNDDTSNAATDAATGLRMDPSRTNRFTSLLSNLHRAIHSLEAAAPCFRGLDVINDRMDPGQTIRAFANTMREDINLVFQMLANEEAPEKEGE